MRWLSNIFWLGTKELHSVLTDRVMMSLIIFMFSLAVYLDANSAGENVNNASIAIVDEDNSALSRKLANAFYPPYFQAPQHVQISEVDVGLDQNRFMFVLVIPPDFEADVRREHRPELQLHIDATAMMQAGLGDSYIQNILLDEVDRFARRSDVSAELPVGLVLRRAFNPNGIQSWFISMTSLLDNITMITILLTGAALIREREHGTIEHLMVMPLTAFQIAISKIWANGLVIIVAFALSIEFMVEGVLDVTVAGSRALLLGGTSIYLFATASIGIFLGTVSRSMAQFALLLMLTFIPMSMLSGATSPIENQPEVIQPITWLLPSRHFISFAQGVVFRGAGLDVVWPAIATMSGLGLVFLIIALLLFRRSMAVGK